MLKRDKIKYIRDKAKARYKKGTECFICGTTENLDFHHFYSLTDLLESWLKEKRKIRPDHYTEEYIIVWRDEFIAEMNAEMYDEAVTLCKAHHLKLHSVYGKKPPLNSGQKQKNWVQIQREKHGLS